MSKATKAVLRVTEITRFENSLRTAATANDPEKALGEGHVDEQVPPHSNLLLAVWFPPNIKDSRLTLPALSWYHWIQHCNHVHSWAQM